MKNILDKRINIGTKVLLTFSNNPANPKWCIITHINDDRTRFNIKEAKTSIHAISIWKWTNKN